MSIDSKWESYFLNHGDTTMNKQYIVNQFGRGLGYNRKIERIYMQKGGSTVKPVMVSPVAQGYDMAESQVKSSIKGSRKRKSSSSGTRKKSNKKRKRSPSKKSIRRKTVKKNVKRVTKRRTGRVSKRKTVKKRKSTKKSKGYF